MAAHAAEQFNLRAGQSLGWQFALAWLRELGLTPEINATFKRLDEAALSHGIGSSRFADEVADWQRRNGVKPADGRLGNATWRAMLARIGPCAGNGIEIGGLVVPLREEPGGFFRIDRTRFRLEQSGGYGLNRSAMRVLVLHQGAFDAQSCFETLIDRGVASHFLIEGQLGQGGKLVVYQILDAARVAWHCGSVVNRWSLGCDICRSPDPQYAERYPRAPLIANPTPRGPSRILALEPEYAVAVKGFLRALCRTLGIADGPHPGHETWDAARIADLRDAGGVVGHCNLVPASKRSDPAFWLHQLF